MCVSEGPQADSEASTLSNPFSWIVTDSSPKRSPAGSASLGPSPKRYPEDCAVTVEQVTAVPGVVVKSEEKDSLGKEPWVRCPDFYSWLFY